MGDLPIAVVAGDVCVDWVRWPVAADPDGPGWRRIPGTASAALPGGALLLAGMMRCIAGVDVRSQDAGDLSVVPPNLVLHSQADLELFPTVLKAGPEVLRVSRFGGYSGPADPEGAVPAAMPVMDDDPSAAVVVLNDVWGTFRESPQVWPAALTAPEANPLVVAKMAAPLAASRLWDQLRQGDPDRLVVVVSARALRDCGVNLSRHLSWERTAKDFVWQLACNPRLAALANLKHLIVRLDLDGAVYYTTGGDGPTTWLFFDPMLVEGGFAASHSGAVSGHGNAFTAALAAALVADGPQDRGGPSAVVVEKGIRAGLVAARRLLRAGYGKPGQVTAFPNASVFVPGEAEDVFARVQVPAPTVTEPADPTFWTILDDLPASSVDDLAAILVRRGKTDSLRRVPVGQFGGLRTADRAEIEGFRSLGNLISEYLAGGTGRPLSVAVFGAPGSGKSFAVTEVAASVAGRHPVKRLEFNLSQFRRVEDLCHAFHTVRDTVLGGSMPLVFFDEFDSAFEGELGWLKYMLAPMQDGVFRDGEATHPIGRAVFVFAGGTSSSFADFARTSQMADPAIVARFRAAKGPDFVSRLRGYVNIAGPNPTDEDDHAYVVRRAMLLRSLLDRKARHLKDSHGTLGIDDGVLRAMLRVPSYRHGARSMEAIIDMSQLADQTSWQPDALPAADQLELHVDADTFLRLATRDVILNAAREVLGQAIHARYLADQQGIKPPDDPSMQPWDSLDKGLRESNRQQADHIATKLRAVDYGILPIHDRAPQPVAFTDDEVEIMAAMEHDRWMTERRLAGWVYAKDRDIDRKRSPCLVPYADLPENLKKWDRQSVRAIPDILAVANHEVHRL
ncbi:MAG: RyR domain-containing protein [Propionicimonas sp.]